MGYLSTDKKKITTKTFAEMKKAGEKVTMLTAYDFTTAGIIDAAGIDSILIGDSASNVMAGNADTLPITVDQMIYHARSVARACQHAFVVCDMPFGSYQISKEEALRNACRMMKETGVDALTLEGGVEISKLLRRWLMPESRFMAISDLPRRALISLAVMAFVPRKRLRHRNLSATPLRWTKQAALPSCWRRFLLSSLLK